MYSQPNLLFSNSVVDGLDGNRSGVEASHGDEIRHYCGRPGWGSPERGRYKEKEAVSGNVKEICQ